MTTPTADQRFTELFDAYAGRVFAYFASGFRRIEAEDLTQQTFLNLWKWMAEGVRQEPDSWSAWIFRIARNVRNDHLRASQSRPAPYPFDDARDAPALPFLQQEEDSMAVRSALTALPNKYRELLLLRTLGLNSSEIGAVLNRSASAIRSQMQNARDAFRRQLRENGVMTSDT